MVIAAKKIKLTSDEKSLLATLYYYDVFQHPLHKNELRNSIENRDTNYIDVVLNNLLKYGLIGQKDDFYFIIGNSQVVEERKNDEQNLDRYLKIAHFMSKIIASCPFVRGVSLSGSISKGRIYKTADIDFFIITEVGKLYISRSLLTFFKKVFLFNSYKYFCLNYFVDVDSLGFKERNRYAATETITLIPTYNSQLFDKLLDANEWIKELYPGFERKDDRHIIPERRRPIKTFLEFILRNKFGNWLDSILMKLTDTYRRNKFSQMSEKKYSYAFQTHKNVSRHHPDDFQNDVMQKYNHRITDFENSCGVSLQDERNI
jgi:hypothetical protein